jgi:hypothetical protein
MQTDLRRQLVRAACAIQTALSRRAREEAAVALPTGALAQCERLTALYALARSRRWNAATSACGRQLRRGLEDLHRQLWASIDELDLPGPRVAASLREIYDDLAALEREFDGVRIDLADHKIAVTTQPIELDGVYLGRFEIVFDWEAFGRRGCCYEVVALNGHASSVDDSVTHPHVRDNDLCEGEAASGLRSALDAGRLFDFFVIVAQTLATYNPGSAYVSLDQWHGAACSDCGATVSDDDSTSCERCESTLCDDCGGGCASCGRTICSECDYLCAGCQENHCGSCVTRCTACRNNFCERCLIDDQCQRCRDAAEDAAREAEADTPETAPSGAPALAPCVGEAALPA